MAGGSGSRTRAERRAAQHNTKYKTELCKNWLERGTCPYGNKCQFAHGPSDMRVREHKPAYKTRPCQAFVETGMCAYGVRCKYRHGDDDEQRLLALQEELLGSAVCPEVGGSRFSPIHEGRDYGERRGGSGWPERSAYEQHGARSAVSSAQLAPYAPSLLLHVAGASSGASSAPSPLSSAASPAGPASVLCLSPVHVAAAAAPATASPAVDRGARPPLSVPPLPYAAAAHNMSPSARAQLLSAAMGGGFLPTHVGQPGLGLAQHPPPPPPTPPPPSARPAPPPSVHAPPPRPLQPPAYARPLKMPQHPDGGMAAAADDESPRDIDAVIDSIPPAGRAPHPHPHRLGARAESIEADMKNELTFGDAAVMPTQAHFLPPLAGDGTHALTSDPAPAAGPPLSATSSAHPRRDAAGGAARASGIPVPPPPHPASSHAALPAISGRAASRSADELVHLLARTQSAIGAELGEPAIPPPTLMERTESNFSIKGVGALGADNDNSTTAQVSRGDSEVVLSFADYYRKALVDQQPVESSPVSDRIANQLSRVLIDDGDALATNASAESSHN